MTNQTSKFIMPCHRLLCWIFLFSVMACSSQETLNNKAQLEVKPQPTPAKPVAKPQPPVASYPLQEPHDSEHLQKANQFVQSGDSPNALKELDLVNQASLSVEQRSLFHLLEAQIALSSGAAEQALTQMENIRPRLLEGDDKIHFYQSLAFAQALTGNTLGSVSARVRLGNLLKNPQQQQENVAAIVDGLSSLPTEQVQQVPLELREELDGWIALAKILQQRNQPGFERAGQLQAWRQGYTGHPANAEFLQSYLASAPQPSPEIHPADKPTAESAPVGPMIAVLLPASGNFASAAQAIKLGLKAAAKAAGSGLPLKFYDTEQGDIAALYQQALNEGAKQVIGPLVKEQIQTLSYGQELKVPVLALNHVENLSKANLYQFGLSPIDEAEQLALKAHKDGRQNAIVLVPNTTQGHRIEQLLTSAWYAQGGMVSGSQSYDPKQHEVGNLLNGLLVPADAAGKKPPQTVFISASPEVARELAPVLKYHQNGDLAIYAMPNVYSGRQDPVHDAELGNIHFCDMPWVLGNSYNGPLSQTALQSTWQNLSDSQIKLFALGLDAYTVSNQLGQLATTPYNGATGRLTLNSGDNRISRHLVCAEFRAGAPMPSGYVD